MTSLLIWQASHKDQQAINEDKQNNAGRWCTTQSCTHKVVHNVGLTNPDTQTDRLTNRIVGSIYG